MTELFRKLKDLAKKKGCTVELKFYESGDCILFLDFGFGMGQTYSIDIPNTFLDKNDVDRFTKWINYLIDFNKTMDKNNQNLNVISDEVDGLIESYAGACTMCDNNDCSDCNIQRFSDELRSLSKTILKLKDK